MSTTENTEGTTTEQAAGDGCGCGACAGTCASEQGAQAQHEGGLPLPVKLLVGGLVAHAQQEIEERKKRAATKVEGATVQEVQAYLQSLYKPTPLDVVRLNANGRVISEIPQGIETAVVARVFDKPLVSGDASHLARFGMEVADCTLLLAITEPDGTKAYAELLFNSVFLEKVE